MGSKKRKKGNPSRRRQAAKSPVSNSRVRVTIIALLIVLIAAVGLAAAIGVSKISSDTADSGGKLSDSVKFPSWVSAPGTPYSSLKGYKAAVDYYDDMSHIPCFCGCGQHSGHKSVQMCFVKSRDGDNFQFNDHGAG